MMRIRCCSCGAVFDSEYIKYDTEKYGINKGKELARCPLCNACHSLIDLGDEENDESSLKLRFHIAEIALEFHRRTMALTLDHTPVRYIQSLKGDLAVIDKSLDTLIMKIEEERRGEQ